MQVSVSAFEYDNLTDREQFWLRKFRHATCMNTLDIQTELSEERAKKTLKGAKLIRELNAINVGYCAREREMQLKGAPTFKSGKTQFA